MRNIRSKQGGFTLIGAMLLVAIAGGIFLAFAGLKAEQTHKQLTDLEAARLTKISTAIVQYLNDEFIPPALSPHKQYNVSGAVFENGKVHLGLDWLKSSSYCGGTASAPSDYLECQAPNAPFISHGLQYRSVIENDGVQVKVKVMVESVADPAVGITKNGKVDPMTAGAIANAAEAKSSNGNVGVSSEYYDANKTTAVVTITIASNTIRAPYLRADGYVKWKGDQEVSTGESVSLKGLTDLTLSGSVIDTDDPSKVLNLDGNTVLNNLQAANNISASKDITASGTLGGSEVIVVNNGTIGKDLGVGGTTRTKDLSATEGVTSQWIETGDAWVSGNIVDSKDPNFFLDLDSTSRFDDAIIGSRGNMRLSDMLPNYVLKGVVLVNADDRLPIVSCGSQGEGRVMLNARTTTHKLGVGGMLVANENLYRRYAVKSGTDWIIKLETIDLSDPAFPFVSDPHGEALASVYCYYPY